MVIAKREVGLVLLMVCVLSGLGFLAGGRFRRLEEVLVDLELFCEIEVDLVVVSDLSEHWRALMIAEMLSVDFVLA